jgi:hypothetical protein
MLNALYFPALRPDPAWTGRLAAIVDRLVCYGAVEGDEPVPGCEARVVAPLGPDRQRFLALVLEMTGRGAEDFKGPLLARAAGGGRDRDEGSGWGLTAALHRGNPATAELEMARRERLWQARLVLKLAERVAIAEAEIERELAAVNRRQAQLLRALQGEDGDEDFLPLPDPVVPGRQLFRIREQLGAWAALYSEDRQPESILVTDSPEAGEMLLEEVEKRRPDGIVSLPDLWLPAGAGAAGTPVRAALARALTGLLGGLTDQGLAALGEAAAAWNKSLAEAGETSWCLRLYLLPGGAARQVLGAWSGLPRAGGALPAPPACLLAIGTICKD